MTGLVGTERRTTNFLTSLTAQRKKLSTVSHADFESSLSLDDFGGATENIPGARSLLHTLTSGVTVGRAERTSVAFEHTAKLLIGENETVRVLTSGTYWSNDVVARLTHSLTPHLSAILAGGPGCRRPCRWPSSHAAPATRDGSFSRSCRPRFATRTRTTCGNSRRASSPGAWLRGIGLHRHRLDRDSMGARARPPHGADDRPGFYRNELAGLAATGYRLEGTVRYAATSWVSIDALFSSRHQEGTLALADLSVRAVTRSRTRNRIAFGATGADSACELKERRDGKWQKQQGSS